MKVRARTGLVLKFLLGACLLAATARAQTTADKVGAQFSGVMNLGSSVKLTFFDLNQKKSTAWLSVGDDINGFKIESYDAAHDLVHLSRAGETVDLPLRDAKALDSPPPTIPPTVVGTKTPGPPIVGKVLLTIDGETQQLGVRLHMGTRNIIPLKDGRSLVVIPLPGGADDTVRYEIGFQNGRRPGPLANRTAVVANVNQPFAFADSTVRFEFDPAGAAK